MSKMESSSSSSLPKSLPNAYFAPAITDAEFNSFHNIDRILYARLVANLRRNPTESMQVMGFWLWLEQEVVDDLTLVKKMLILPFDLVSEIADETVLCLKCVESETYPFPEKSKNQELFLLPNFVQRNITFEYFFENRIQVIKGVKRMITEVCSRAFRDILQKVSPGTGFFQVGSGGTPGTLTHEKAVQDAAKTVVQSTTPTATGSEKPGLGTSGVKRTAAAGTTETTTKGGGQVSYLGKRPAEQAGLAIGPFALGTTAPKAGEVSFSGQLPTATAGHGPRTIRTVVKTVQPHIQASGPALGSSDGFKFTAMPPVTPRAGGVQAAAFGSSDVVKFAAMPPATPKAGGVQASSLVPGGSVNVVAPLTMPKSVEQVSYFSNIDLGSSSLDPVAAVRQPFFIHETPYQVCYEYPPSYHVVQPGLTLEQRTFISAPQALPSELLFQQYKSGPPSLKQDVVDLDDFSQLFKGLKLFEGEGDPSPDDRTIFLTFSKGYPITAAEVKEFFTKKFGDFIESIQMQEVAGDEQVLFARVIARSAAFVNAVVEGGRAKYNINGKHVWARKFVKKQKSPPPPEAGCPSPSTYNPMISSIGTVDRLNWQRPNN